jgi:hypothetical protein
VGLEGAVEPAIDSEEQRGVEQHPEADRRCRMEVDIRSGARRGSG